MTELSDYYLERLGSHSPAVVPIPLRVGANTIGRLPTNHIVLNSKYASRRHCTIYVTETDQLMAKNDAVRILHTLIEFEFEFMNLISSQQTESSSMASKKSIETLN